MTQTRTAAGTIQAAIHKLETLRVDALIVTPHRTIDAQLAILRDGLNDSTLIAARPDLLGQSDVADHALRLARALLGESRRDDEADQVIAARARKEALLWVRGAVTNLIQGPPLDEYDRALAEVDALIEREGSK